MAARAGNFNYCADGGFVFRRHFCNAIDTGRDGAVAGRRSGEQYGGRSSGRDLEWSWRSSSNGDFLADFGRVRAGDRFDWSGDSALHLVFERPRLHSDGGGTILNGTANGKSGGKNSCRLRSGSREQKECDGNVLLFDRDVRIVAGCR